MATSQLIVDAVYKGKAQMAQARQDIEGIESTAKGGATTGLRDFASAATVAAGAVVAVGYAAKKAFDFAQEGAQIKQTQESFENLNATILKTPDLLDRMSAASGGTISNLDAMRGVLTLVAGQSDEAAQHFANAAPQLLEIAKAAQKLNPSLGDTAFLYDSISTGIKRSSPLILDNLGIVVKVGEANEKYAQSIGKTVTELTAEEKSMALLNATLETGQTLIRQAGGEAASSADSYASLGVELSNLKTEALLAADEGLSPLISKMAEGLKAAREFREGVDASFSAGIDTASSIEDLENLADGMRNLSRTDTAKAGQQMQEIGIAVARVSANHIDFEKNLTKVLGTAGGIRAAGSDFRKFYDEFSRNEAIKESTVALEGHLQAIEENKRAIAEAVSFFEKSGTVYTKVAGDARELAAAYYLNADAAQELGRARLDKVAEDIAAKAEADKAAAAAAEEHAAAMQRQAEELSRVSAQTGDYFTAISSGGGFESFIEYGLQAADVAGANALQLAAYAEKAGIATDASQTLGKALGQAAADAAAAEFTQTGDLDAYISKLQEIETTVGNFPSLDKLLRDQAQSQVMVEESPFFRIEEDAPAAVQLLNQVTDAGVTGFSAIADSASGVMQSITDVAAAIASIPSVTATINLVTTVNGQPLGQGQTVNDALAAQGVR